MDFVSDFPMRCRKKNTGIWRFFYYYPTAFLMHANSVSSSVLLSCSRKLKSISVFKTRWIVLINCSFVMGIFYKEKISDVILSIIHSSFQFLTEFNNRQFLGFRLCNVSGFRISTGLFFVFRLPSLLVWDPGIVWFWCCFNNISHRLNFANQISFQRGRKISIPRRQTECIDCRNSLPVFFGDIHSFFR